MTDAKPITANADNHVNGTPRIGLVFEGNVLVHQGGMLGDNRDEIDPLREERLEEIQKGLAK